jgi:NodT family efflux transporter outer membrane factor (OMF) lipoprotein
MKMYSRMLTCALVPLVIVYLAGCAMGPDYKRPDVPMSDSYKETGIWKEARPSDTLPKGTWWVIFHDPVLTGLMEEVNVSNQTIIQAEAQFRQAVAVYRVARANLFPILTGGVAYTRSLRSATFSQSQITGGVPISDYNLPVDLTWEADVRGRIRRGVEADREQARASAADLESARLSMQATLAQTYFQLRTVDAQVQLLTDSVKAYEEALVLTQNRYAAGIAGRADVVQAEIQLQSTQAQLVELGVQRAQLEHAIAVLTGKPPAELSLPTLVLASVPPSIPVGVPSELLERRPDVAAAERRVAAANAQIGAAKAAFFPRITLTASAGYESTDLSKWLTWPSHYWSLGPALTQTLFAGGSLMALADEARAAYDASVASYRQTVLNAFKDVEDNLAALRILEKEALAQDAAVKAAREYLTITNNQYREGIVAYLNVIVAQTALRTNERTAVDIAGRRMVAAALLVKALGGGWDASSLAKP